VPANLPGSYPAGKWWALSKSTQHNTQWIHFEQTCFVLWQSAGEGSTKYSLGTVRATLHPDAPVALELSIALTEGSWTLASPHLILSWVGYPAGQRDSTNAKWVALNKWGELHLRQVLCNRASTIQTQSMEAVKGSQVGGKGWVEQDWILGCKGSHRQSCQF